METDGSLTAKNGIVPELINLMLRSAADSAVEGLNE